jgi:hypothetical protein
MIKSFEDVQKLGKDNVDLVVKSLGAAQKGAQAIASEVQDYSKKALDAGSAHVEKLLAVKAFDKALELQTAFAKSSYEGFLAHVTKVGELYGDFAKEAAKPFEAMIPKAAK